MADFRDIYERAKSGRTAELAQNEADKAARQKQETQNLIDAEEWLTRVVIETLTRAKSELSGKFDVDFHDDFIGVKTKDTNRRQVVFTLSPLARTNYKPLPHYVFVDSNRQVKCIAHSKYDDQGPREVFWGNIDDATGDDFEEQIAGIVKWWADREG